MTKENIDSNLKIVRLRDQEGMTFRAIAMALSIGGRPIAESNVRSIYYRTKGKLKNGEYTNGKS